MVVAAEEERLKCGGGSRGRAAAEALLGGAVGAVGAELASCCCCCCCGCAEGAGLEDLTQSALLEEAHGFHVFGKCWGALSWQFAEDESTHSVLPHGSQGGSLEDGKSEETRNPAWGNLEVASSHFD